MITSRSMVARTSVRLASPLAIVVAAFLFFAGHNQPGGGFAAGLVLGAVVALRMVVGLPTIGAPILMLAVGGVIAAVEAMAPIAFGDVLLDQVVADVEVPGLGKVKAGSALIFDLGVTLVVVGLMACVLDALGASDLGSSGTRGDDAAGDRE